MCCYALPPHPSNHRMAWVEKDLRDHLVPTPCYMQGRQPADQAAQRHIQPGLQCLQGWGIHSLLGQPVQCVTILWVKNFLLISNLNLPCLSLKPFPFVLSLSTLVNSHSPPPPPVFMLPYMLLCVSDKATGDRNPEGVMLLHSLFCVSQAGQCALTTGAPWRAEVCLNFSSQYSYKTFLCCCLFAPSEGVFAV